MGLEHVLPFTAKEIEEKLNKVDEPVSWNDLNDIPFYDESYTGEIKIEYVDSAEKVTDKKQFNPIDLYKFQLFESGKARINLWNCHNASYRNKPTIFEFTAIAHRELDRPKFYTSSIAKAHKLGYPVLNCLLCKHRTRNDDGTPYCEKTGMVVKVESEAINCPNYLYDEKRRNRFIESYKQFEYLGLNLWERNPNHKIIKFCK